MSIFGNIMSKVFGAGHPAATSDAGPAATQATNTAAAPGSAPPAVPGSPSADAGSTSPAPPAPGGTVDGTKVLDGMDAGKGLDWRHSIVDLMKLLDMDSSLTARKELAHELSYTGDTGDSAAMNMWLHKEVMAKFAANGGKLPADLQH